MDDHRLADQAAAAEQEEHSADLALAGLCLAPLSPPSALRQRLLDKVAAEMRAEPAVTVRSDEGRWVPAGAPGVDVKLLYVDTETKLRTMLVRLAPGGHYPAHRHHEAEQCLILEGELRWGGLVYRAGDFVVAGKGSVHPRISSDTGLTMLIIAGHNEFV